MFRTFRKATFSFFLVGLACHSVGWAAELQIPLKCYVEQGSKERAWDCTAYNTQDPLKLNKNNVCRFEDGRWTQGHYRPKAAKKYTPVRTCTGGVEVKTLDSNVNIRGPKAFRDGTSKVDGKVFRTWVNVPQKTKGFVSYNYSEVPTPSGEPTPTGEGSSTPGSAGDLALQPNEVPVSCYLAFGGTGALSSNPVSCTTEDMNAATFCELREFKKPQAGYQGWWWVQYSAKNKAGMRVCAGGVETMKLTQDQMDEKGQLVTGKQKTFLLAEKAPSDSVGNTLVVTKNPQNYRWDSETNSDIKSGIVIGCYLSKAKDGTPTAYRGCVKTCPLGGRGDPKDDCSNSAYPMIAPVAGPASLPLDDGNGGFEKNYTSRNIPYGWGKRLTPGDCWRDANLGPFKKNFNYGQPGLRTKQPTWKYYGSECKGGLLIAAAKLEGCKVGDDSCESPALTEESPPRAEDFFLTGADNVGVGPAVSGAPKALIVGPAGVGINNPPSSGNALSVGGNALVTGNTVVTGSITAQGSVASSSDSRLKRLVAPIPGALDKVLGLRGVTYFWKKKVVQQSHLEDVRQIGLIAQEVEAVVPEAVKTDSRGMKSVTYPNLVAVLVEAIKDQQQQIEQLKKDKERLDARLQQIEARQEKKQ